MMTQNVFAGARECLRAITILLGIFFSGFTFAKSLTPIRKIPHSGYSEGLDFYDGFLWHSLPKQILKIDPADGSILEKFDPATEYSESITWFKNHFWNLSWSDNGIYAVAIRGSNLAAAKVNEKLPFVRKGSTPEVHGWGITHDEKNLIITGDESSKLYFLDPKTTQVVRKITVKDPKTSKEISGLEDLAWDGRYLWSSSFTSYPGTLFQIDAQTGLVHGFYPLPVPEECSVIDGTAVEGRTLWVTGKHCTSIYSFKLPD